MVEGRQAEQGRGTGDFGLEVDGRWPGPDLAIGEGLGGVPPPVSPLHIVPVFTVDGDVCTGTAGFHGREEMKPRSPVK